MNQIKKFKSNI